MNVTLKVPPKSFELADLWTAGIDATEYALPVDFARIKVRSRRVKVHFGVVLFHLSARREDVSLLQSALVLLAHVSKGG